MNYFRPFNLTLKPSLQAILFKLPPAVPHNFREESLLAAHYFQALESGTALVTRDGLDLTSQMDRFAEQFVSTGFVWMHYYNVRHFPNRAVYPSWVHHWRDHLDSQRADTRNSKTEETKPLR